MTIEIKVTGGDAAETVQQFLGLAGYFNGAQTQASTATPAPAAPAAVETEEPDDETLDYATATDENGVSFNEDFFGKAAKPFYPNGQWKKRKGVAQDAYDAHYAAELSKLKAPVPAETQVATVETPVAPTAPTVGAPAAESPAVTPVPQTPAPAPTVEIPVAPAPQAPAPQPSAPAAETGKTHAELQGLLTQTLGAINGALPGRAAPILMGMLEVYGVKAINAVPADKVDECYNRLKRIIADPTNAEAIAAGLM